MNDRKLTAAEVIVSDPLSPVTRAERKSLLGVCSIALAIEYAGIVPTKISALGIEFSQADQRRLLFALACVVAYYMVAFVTYAWNDHIAWQLSHSSAADQVIEFGRGPDRRREVLSPRDPALHPLLRDEYERRSRFAPAASLVRVFVEFLFPVVLALCAIVALVSR